MFTHNELDPRNCSFHPTYSQSNQDITGIGISLSWTVTAGLALCLVIANYVLVYRPDVDPFGLQTRNLEDPSRPTFRPNPIDSHLLGWRLKKSHHAHSTTESLQVQLDSQERRNRLQEALTQCMLTMCDYQLITGLAVLVSGYSQLPSGIPMEHWERIIDLAWFSSITHLCCLTFLRQHFCKNWRAQIWRITGMVILITLLCVALIPSAHYVDVKVKHKGSDGTQEDYESKLDFAKCFFRRRGDGVRGKYYLDREERIDSKKQNALVSAGILIFGMTNRIWRIFQTSTNAYKSARRRLSHYTRKFLRWVRDRTTSTSVVLADIVYRPILASYLMFHVLLTILLSKVFEVWWLIIGLFWGFTNLIPITKSADLEWTFGQVIAAFMLIAPMITLTETLATTLASQRSKITSSNSSNRPTAMSTEMQPDTTTVIREDADYNFYNVSLSFTVGVYVITSFIAAMGLLTLAFKATGGGYMRPLDMMWAYSITPNLLLLVYAIGCILCSLPIDHMMPTSVSGRIIVGICTFFLFTFSIVGGFVAGIFHPLIHYSAAFPFGLYPLLLVLEQLLTKRPPSNEGNLSTNSNEGAAVSLSNIRRSSMPRSHLARGPELPALEIGHGALPAPTPVSLAFKKPQRQDTEADIAVVTPRVPWTSQI